MAVWAIADLHLSFGVPNKKMDVFGPQWINYTDKIEKHWNQLIDKEDLVLIAGDISWAKRTEDARPDFEWIDRLPGTKVFIKGNHDYWWASQKKNQAILPASCTLIHNNSFTWKESIAIAGTRLWNVPGLDFKALIDFKENVHAKQLAQPEDEQESIRIYQKELERLEMSLKAMDANAKTRLVMTHYPPISHDLQESDVSKLLEKYHVDHCIFGHLHSLKPNLKLFGVRNQVHYHLTACDYLDDFKPLRIL